MNSTTSALTKLTNRLNFLKERRSQIANELQNLDKGRGLALAITTLDKGRGSEFHESLQDTDKSQGSEVHSVQNLEKSREIEGSKSFQNLDKGLEMESHLPRDSESFGKPDGQFLQNLGGGNSEGRHP